MRTPFITVAVIVALAVAGCGNDADKTAPAPPKTSTTSGAVPNDPPPASTTTNADRGSDTAGSVKADNTGRNANDDAQSQTPLDQGTSEQDVAITQSVRKAVMAHKGLSVNAQNVKIIAKDGVVTLRGPVASDSERSTIVAMAEQVPAVHTVVNKLEIAR